MLPTRINLAPVDRRICSVGRRARLGRDIDDSQLREIRLYGDHYINPNSRHWYELAKSLSTTNLADLLCGLVYCNTEFECPQNSFTWSRGLVDTLVRREPGIEFLDDVIGYVCTTAKGWLHPYGPMLGSANNYSQYVALARLMENKIEFRKEKQAAARKMRAKREEMNKVAAEHWNTHHRANVKAAMQGMRTMHQLKLIAYDDVYPPHFYPTYIAASATKDIISELTQEEIELLYRKLIGRKRGAWRNFKHRLREHKSSIGYPSCI